ncbi:MAG: hypothetical protein ACRC5M_05465 [Anaeroplasmataceae bacterium]
MTTKYKKFNDENFSIQGVIPIIEEDFKEIDISFLRDVDKCEYMRFYNPKDMSVYVFDRIEKEKLDTSVFILKNIDYVKLVSNEIKAGPVLMLLANSTDSEIYYTFVGVK